MDYGNVQRFFSFLCQQSWMTSKAYISSTHVVLNVISVWAYFGSSSCRSYFFFLFLFFFFNLKRHPGVVGKGYPIRRCSCTSSSAPFHHMTLAETFSLSQQKVTWFGGKAAATMQEGSVVGAKEIRPFLSGRSCGAVKFLGFLWPVLRGTGPSIHACREQNDLTWKCLLESPLYGNYRGTPAFLIPDKLWLGYASKCSLFIFSWILHLASSLEQLPWTSHKPSRSKIKDLVNWRAPGRTSSNA